MFVFKMNIVVSLQFQRNNRNETTDTNILELLLSAPVECPEAKAKTLCTLETSRDCIILHYLNVSLAESLVSNCFKCFSMSEKTFVKQL